MPGFLSGLANQLTVNLQDQQAADAYSPLLDSVYGAQPKPQGFSLSQMLGLGSAPPQATTQAAGGLQPPMAPGGPGIGSDTVAGQRTLADLGSPSTGAGGVGMTASQAQAAVRPQSLATLGVDRGAMSGQVRREAILSLLSNPETRETGKALLLNYGRLPEQKSTLTNDLQEYKFAKDQGYPGTFVQYQTDLKKAGRSGDGSGGGQFGLNPVWGTDANGNPAMLQLGKDGRPQQVPLPNGFNIARDPIRVDTGMGTALLDPQTRQQIGFIPKDVAGEAAATTMGKGQGEAAVSLPAARQVASAVQQQIAELKADPYLKNMVGPINSRLPNVSADAARVQARIDQLQGGAFLQARQMLKGGGQITDYEGRKAEAAVVRMNQAQSLQDFNAALDDFNSAVGDGIARRVERAEAEMGSSLAEGAGGYAPSGSATIRPASGADRAGRGRFEQASGGEGVSGTQPLIPNFDEAALGRLRDANDATKARASTYGTKPVGDVLRRSGQDGPFSVPAASVPARFFRPGPRGYEDVQALRRAVDDPQTMKTIRDYALSTLRRFAEGQDGTLDPSKVTIWRQRHQDALRAFPEIDRMLKGPVEASETMARVAVARKAELDEFRAGAIGRLIDADPEDVTRKLGALFSTESPVKTMRRLEAETRNNPEAREGLRKGVADWITQRFISNTEAGASSLGQVKSDQFQTFMKQNAAALGVIFKPGEVSALKALAADLQQANRSVTAVKLPGRSNTPQDIIAAARDANIPQSWLSWALLRGAQGAAGTAVAGPWGAAAAPIAGELLGALRRSGIQKVDDIIADAMLNPGRALMLLSKAPARPTQKDVASFATRYRKAVFPSVLAQLDGESEPRQ